MLAEPARQPGRCDDRLDLRVGAATACVGKGGLAGPPGLLGNVAARFFIETEGNVSSTVANLVGHPEGAHGQAIAAQVPAGHVYADELIGQHGVDQFVEKRRGRAAGVRRP